jgi:hypothetical protein
MASQVKAYLVCCGENGRAVIYGRAAEAPVVGQPFGLKGARMVLSWSSECGGLFGLAANGPKTDTRITPAVSYHQDICAKQVIGVDCPEAFDQWASVGK